MKMCRCTWKHWSIHSHNLLSVCSNTDRQHREFKLTVCSSFAFYINSIKMTNLQNLRVVIVRKCVQKPHATVLKSTIDTVVPTELDELLQ